MSRGPGRTMRVIADRLKRRTRNEPGRWFTTAEVASMLYRTKKPTATQVANVHHSLDALYEHGCVLTRHTKGKKAREWIFIKGVRPKAKPEVLPVMPLVGGKVNRPRGGLWSPENEMKEYKQPKAKLVLSPPTQPSDQPVPQPDTSAAKSRG